MPSQSSMKALTKVRHAHTKESHMVSTLTPSLLRRAMIIQICWRWAEIVNNKRTIILIYIYIIIIFIYYYKNASELGGLIQ
jgi:hypothetical protein